LHPTKKYLYSFLSLLCIIAWGILVFIVFYADNDNLWVATIPIAYLLTIAAGIVGGSIIILIRSVRKRRLKYSFIYNFYGTLNIIIGTIGLVYTTPANGRTAYHIGACFAVGLYIYNDIYFKK
jgi:hypothetical protein